MKVYSCSQSAESKMCLWLHEILIPNSFPKWLDALIYILEMILTK